MCKIISICENGINIYLEIDEDKDVHLLHFSALPFDVKTIDEQWGHAYGLCNA